MDKPPFPTSIQDDATDVERVATTNKPTASTVAPILCYCCASILMTIVNKFVVSGTHFSMNFLLLWMQSLVGVTCVTIAKKTGIIRLQPIAVHHAKAWLPISILLVSVIYTGSKSLQFLNIPAYTIFKNLTIILIAYGEVLWFGGRITRLSFISFTLMVISSVIAAQSDASGLLRTSATSSSYELNVGYLWMLMNCLASAAYVLAMRKRIKITGFSDWDSMFYNNLLCIPILAICSIVLEDWGIENLTRNFPQDTRNFLFIAIAFSGTAAVGISYSTAWCIRATSSTTYSMVGALNKLPVAASGMLFFGDPVTPGSLLGVGIGFLAGLLYSVAKNHERKGTDARLPVVNRIKPSSWDIGRD